MNTLSNTTLVSTVDVSRDVFLYFFTLSGSLYNLINMRKEKKRLDRYDNQRADGPEHPYLTAGLGTHLNAFNPLVTNGLSNSYHLDESIFIFRGIRSIFSFLCPQLRRSLGGILVWACPSVCVLHLHSVKNR